MQADDLGGVVQAKAFIERLSCDEALHQAFSADSTEGTT